MKQERIDKINYFARESKIRELTEEEKKEREELRKEYIEAVRANLRSQLENIRIKESDGTIRKLRKKSK